MNKRCSMCRVNKPLTAFWRHAGRHDGRQTICRDCYRSPRVEAGWDGHSTYSDTGALREPYKVVCLAGGHESGVYLLTRQRAALVRTAGLPRCGVCQSWCWLEPDSDMPSRRAAVKEHHASGLGTVEA